MLILQRLKFVKVKVFVLKATHGGGDSDTVRCHFGGYLIEEAEILP